MNAAEALAVLGQYTADQWGLVTAAQAKRAGVGGMMLSRLADAGHLELVRRGVYAVGTAPASTARAEQAAWLSLNPGVPAWERPILDPDGGVVSHTSATRVHDVGDLVATAIEMTVPRRRTSRDPLVRLRVRELAEDDVVLVDGLPVTSLERTVADLLEEHTDGSQVAEVIRSGVETRSLDLDKLAPRIGPYARRYGIKTRDGYRLIETLMAQIGSSVAGSNSPVVVVAVPDWIRRADLVKSIQRAIPEDRAQPIEKRNP